MADEMQNFVESIRSMQPLIILGMHRSGTSLLVRLLKDLGLHMGNKLSRDAEAVYFQKINRRIFISTGSDWGYINPLLLAMGNEFFIQEQTSKALLTLFPDSSLSFLNHSIIDFFGKDLWKSISQNENFHWGWKDPRTSITFPIWLRIFPQARFLHILRNGIDVSISIHRRTKKQHNKIWKRLFPLDYNPRTLDFKYCFRLWEMYVEFVLDHKDIIPDNQYMEINYENLLKNPSAMLQEICDFINFPIQENLLQKTCEQINQNRLDNSFYTKEYQYLIQQVISSSLMQRLYKDYSINLQDDTVRNEP